MSDDPAARLRELADCCGEQDSADILGLLDDTATLRAQLAQAEQEMDDLRIKLAVGQVEQRSQETDTLRAQLAQAQQDAVDAMHAHGLALESFRHVEAENQRYCRQQNWAWQAVAEALGVPWWDACPPETETLIERARQERTARERYEQALQEIKANYGKVCADFELCRHVSCQSSSAAWLTADLALTAPTGAGDKPCRE